MDRREFLAGGAALAAAGAVGAADFAKKPKKPSKDLIWANKWQLGTHDQSGPKYPLDPNGHYLGDTFRRVDEESLWRRMKMAKAAGCNLMRIPVLESLVYPSHPEISLKGSWTAEKMHDVMKRIREEFGMETIPVLNFSTGHSTWLGIYSRMISSPIYYKVCADLIRDVYEVFGKPRFFHYGMDEESPDTHGTYYTVYREKDLYWHDNRFFVDTIEKLGARPWCDADKIWWGDEEFRKNMPKSVLLSNWCYSSTFDLGEIHRLAEKAGSPLLEKQFRNYVTAYDRLDSYGYDQVAEGSCWYSRLDKAAGMDRAVAEGSFSAMMRYCAERIDPSRLKGFSMTHWIGTSASGDERYRKYCELLGKAKMEYEAL